MRKASIVAGCIVVLALSGGSVAAEGEFVRVEFHFLRPQTNIDQFHQDLRRCKLAAKKMDWSRERFHWGRYVMRTSLSASAFQRCMTENGYRLDPDGFSTGRMRMTV